MLIDIHGRTVIIENQVPMKRGDREGQASSDSNCGQLIGQQWLQEAEKMKGCSLRGNGGSQEKCFFTLRENWQYLNGGEIHSVDGKEG